MFRVLTLLLLILAGALAWASGLLTIRSSEVGARSGDTTLAGLLAVPRFGTPPFPAVVVVHGSGATTRSALRGFVARLVPAGFAVLIHDKRGTGASGGVYVDGVPVGEVEGHLRELASDVAAWVRVLREDPRVDPDQIGLVGGSQAGWVMPLAALEEPSVAYIAALSGPTVSFAEEDAFSKLTGDDPGRFVPGELSDAEIRRRVEAVDHAAGYDPRDALTALRVPSLWIFGSADRSVPTELCRERIESFPADVRGRMEVHWIEGANHDLDLPDGTHADFWTPLIAWLHARANDD